MSSTINFNALENQLIDFSREIDDEELALEDAVAKVASSYCSQLANNPGVAPSSSLFEIQKYGTAPVSPVGFRVPVTVALEDVGVPETAPVTTTGIPGVNERISPYEVP